MSRLCRGWSQKLSNWTRSQLWLRRHPAGELWRGLEMRGVVVDQGGVLAFSLFVGCFGRIWYIYASMCFCYVHLWSPICGVSWNEVTDDYSPSLLWLLELYSMHVRAFVLRVPILWSPICKVLLTGVAGYQSFSWPSGLEYLISIELGKDRAIRLRQLLLCTAY